MPLNVRRFCTSVLLVFVSFVISAEAQSLPDSSPQKATIAPGAGTQMPPTSGDVMRDRISKSKAYIAVRNYNAAIYELENIRRETTDAAVHAVVNVLLMNSYLEQGDYKRAQDLLNEFYAEQKTTKVNAGPAYIAVAGQVVKGARSRVERYRALGLSLSDRMLPLEATNDLEKLRETLELVITQSKEIGTDKDKAADAMALIEEASNSRSMLARDDYDSRRWKDELADTREKVIQSRSNLISDIRDPASPDPSMVAENKPAGQSIMQPVADVKANSVSGGEVIRPAKSVPSEPQKGKPIIVSSAPPSAKDSDVKDKAKPVDSSPAVPNVDKNTPLDVGSLLAYATVQTQPIYPAAAKSMRSTGVVKVEFTVNEEGEVSDVQKASGPSLLQAAAKEAIRGWKFRPFLRDGEPVKATGYVSFNFAL